MTYCQSITQILRIIWIRSIPLSLRSKTRRRATPLLPTWIYSCRSRRTISCTLPFTTNVTIPTSISQTFLLLSSNIPFLPAYGVFISQLIRYARVCSFYECFILRASGNVWNRPSGSFMVDMGISSHIMKSPSPKCYMAFFGYDHIQWHPRLIRHCTNLWTYYRTGTYYRFDLFTNFGRFP